MRTPIKRRSIATVGIAVATLMVSNLSAAEPADFLGRAGRHRILSGELPPGAVGQARLSGRGPVAGYFQPVSIFGPQGAHFALASNGSFVEPTPSIDAGLLIGSVYRFQITRIAGAEGVELYPTIELIDRTYPPPGLATRYPIQVHLDQEDLEAAMAGQLVTRVVYLEDPQTATPQVQDNNTIRPYDISGHQDPLEVADRLGRPVAIVRIGSVSPPQAPLLIPQFFFGHPIWAPIQQPDPVQQP